MSEDQAFAVDALDSLVTTLDNIQISDEAWLILRTPLAEATAALILLGRRPALIEGDKP